MVETMNPSRSATAAQIGKICDLLTAKLRQADLPSEPTQQIIETQGEALAVELVTVVRRRVEVISNLITRRVKVDRSRTPQQALDATGRKQYTNRSVVDSMPRSRTVEVEVFFFKLDLSQSGGYISDADLEKEYDSRGYKPADPYSLAAVNEADPTFADTHPNATHWQDKNGNWCLAAFDLWNGERGVYVHRSGDGWSVSWWFAGFRK